MPNATTALLNSTTMTPLSRGLRLTDLERRYGRLMRSPDGHDDSGASSGDTGASSGAGADEGAAAAVADAGDAGQGADESTLLGSATAGDGTGSGEGGEGKDDAPAGDTKAAGNDDTGVPETYELKPFTVGEGDDASTVEIDAGLLETVTPGLKEAGIKQEQLDKLAPLVPAIQEAALKQMNDSFEATRADWAAKTKSDPEIGGKNFDETMRLAGKALDMFGARSEIKDGKETNPFRILLNQSGIGNHPDYVRVMRNIGAAASEDSTLVRNTTEVKQVLSREQRSYPEDQPN